MLERGNAVLVDTCGWIDFLRHKDTPLGDAVEALIAEDRASLCSVSVAELLQGAKGKKEAQQLDLLFTSVPILDVVHADWVDAGKQVAAQRALGFAISLTDALVAAVAVRNRLPVLSDDAQFARLGVALM
jgi:predicted nucleic acid-binding protein